MFFCFVLLGSIFRSRMTCWKENLGAEITYSALVSNNEGTCHPLQEGGSLRDLFFL